jgi:sulfite exporter TauE/SafE
MSYGLLFLLGLLTGFHCVSMCSGFVLSYTAENARLGKRSYLSHPTYGIGKTLSYAAIGAVFGLFGAVIRFRPFLRRTAGAIAGVFLIIFGPNQLASSCHCANSSLRCLDGLEIWRQVPYLGHSAATLATSALVLWRKHWHDTMQTSLPAL